ncbi:aldehyde dehydrogenase family protein [Streptomyces sp. NPDC051561]|uniref:aldehyde dehydrogenase family protein n=1 Tax=Streptomyces sp. NPDC051561 TaxID=3365658 RepID=UPI00378DCAE5
MTGSPLAATARVVSRNPADPVDIVANVPNTGTWATVEAADNARDAQRAWYAAGASARSAALTDAARAVEQADTELAELAVREVGKPLTEARAEVSRTVAILRYYSQLPYDATGSVHEPAAGPGLLLTRRRPHGVAGLVTPWNFPYAIPVWKAAPALAAGNTVVLKPAPEATACALRLTELLQQALPTRVFTLVPGGAPEGHALVTAADVVSFTGSTAAGGAVVRAATARGIPVQAEAGGLNAALVLPDADPVGAAAHIASAIAGYAGQKCTATSRVIAVGGALGPLREALAEALRAIPAADPTQLDTVCGPLISERARERVLAASRDVPLLAGGKQSDGPGWYAGPTLVEQVPSGHPLLREEVFGPVAVLLHARDLDTAIRMTNSVPYGLVTSVHTGNLDAALRGLDGLDTGMIRINAPSTGVDFHLPFGGTKSSSHGPREQGRTALDFYTTTRTYALHQAAIGAT